MIAVAGAFLHPQLVHARHHAGVVVVARDVVRLGLAPTLVEGGGRGSHSGLVPAAVADVDDVLEAVYVKAVPHVLEHHLEGLVAHGEGAGITHVTGLRLESALRHQLDDRCAEGIAEFARDCVARPLEHVVMLAQGDVGPVLLDAPGGNDGGGPAGSHRIAHLDPGQLLDPDGVQRSDGVFHADLGLEGGLPLFWRRRLHGGGRLRVRSPAGTHDEEGDCRQDENGYGGPCFHLDAPYARRTCRPSPFGPGRPWGRGAYRHVSTRRSSVRAESASCACTCGPARAWTRGRHGRMLRNRAS